MTAATRDPHLKAITDALAAPFDPKDIKFKPQMVKNNRALAMGYLDARRVQDRLDEVLGVENWQDRYDFLPDGSVVCTLRLCIGGRWIRKTDVGSPSEQPDAGDRVKAAVSDALKRAAVKFGIGRYLYRLPAVWVDYDPVKKQLLQVPQLPAWAVPPPAKAPQQQPPAKAPPAEKPKPQGGQHQSPPTETPEQRAAADAHARLRELEAARKAADWSWDDCLGWFAETYPQDGVRYVRGKTRFTDVEPSRVSHLIRFLNTLNVQKAG